MSSIEDEIHNIQAVIDSISMDLLHEDLSHLTGESMVHGYVGSNQQQKQRKKKSADLVSIEYLLDIIRSLNEWISSRMESHVDADDSSKLVLSQSSQQQAQPIQKPTTPVCFSTVSTSPIVPAPFQTLNLAQPTTTDSLQKPLNEINSDLDAIKVWKLDFFSIYIAINEFVSLLMILL